MTPGRLPNLASARQQEAALREFPKLSSRAIASMCGVSHRFVDDMRPVATVANAPQVLDSIRPSAVMTSDGRQYPSRRERTQAQEAEVGNPRSPRP